MCEDLNEVGTAREDIYMYVAWPCFDRYQLGQPIVQRCFERLYQQRQGIEIGCSLVV